MIELAPLHAVALVTVGLVAGVVNTLAGGGSLLVVPLLVALGLPETTANGTSRLALIVQNATALARYQRAGMVEWGVLRRVVGPALLGAAAGARAGAVLDDALFRQFLAWVMLGVAAVVVLSSRKKPEEAPQARLPRALVAPVFFGVGVFGGMIQAGVGYLILGALVVGMGVPLARANVVKVALIAAYTPIALLFFASAGKVSLVPALLVTVGQAIGGWVGAAQALARGEPLLRKALVVAVVATALHLLGVTTWLLALCG